MMSQEIIETLRMEEVVNIVKAFVADNKLRNDYVNALFTGIYNDNCYNNRIKPQNLFYHKLRVYELLDDFKKNLVQETKKASDSVPTTSL